MGNDENPKEQLNAEKLESLAAVLKSDALNSITKIEEKLQSWYPELSEKEMVVCRWTFFTMSDLHTGNSAFYDELSARLVENGNFANEKEIQDVIKSLESKSVLEIREEKWIFGDTKATIKVLAFTQENLCMELHNL
ncbi:MAG TPA: hypothetical protein VJ772_06040 [Nitrososphaeraceae archaeon]|nr:hypothetical protein [Nitrososphaeraceae archaeon]